MNRLLWIDLEMSGLHVETCRILEVAAIVTDVELREQESFHAVIYQPPDVLDTMDPWCKETHGKSGLTAAVREGRPEDHVERDVAALIDRHWRPEERAILCGNSISTDRDFIRAYWPRVAHRLHYRLIDVSSWKTVLRERFGITFEKSGGHRALDDIRESIAELGFYVSLVDPERTKTTDA